MLILLASSWHRALVNDITNQMFFIKKSIVYRFASKKYLVRQSLAEVYSGKVETSDRLGGGVVAIDDCSNIPVVGNGSYNSFYYSPWSSSPGITSQELCVVLLQFAIKRHKLPDCVSDGFQRGQKMSTQRKNHSQPDPLRQYRLTALQYKTQKKTYRSSWKSEIPGTCHPQVHPYNRRGDGI